MNNELRLRYVLIYLIQEKRKINEQIRRYKNYIKSDNFFEKLTFSCMMGQKIQISNDINLVRKILNGDVTKFG